VLSVYRYDLSDLLVAVYTPAGLLQYQNTASVRASGVEAEINGHPVPWLEISASMAMQRAIDSAQLPAAQFSRSDRQASFFRSPVYQPVIAFQWNAVHGIAADIRQRLTAAGVPPRHHGQREASAREFRTASRIKHH
jgi:outer membrane cobalamin receptor